MGCLNTSKTDETIIELVQNSYFDGYKDYTVKEYTKALQAAYSDDADIGEKWEVYDSLSEAPKAFKESALSKSDLTDKKIIEYRYQFFLDETCFVFQLLWTYDGDNIKYDTILATNVSQVETLEPSIDTFIELIASTYDYDIPHYK